MDQAHPTRFGPYTLLGEIARGGMGIVYLGEDLAGIRVALKLPRPELATDPRERARFVQEMRLTASLHHPNIVQLLQGGDERGHLYIVMEYVEGSTLRTEIDRRRRLPPLEAIRIATQVARALTAAHEHQPAIVHRDLKPGNILLRNDGVAKVTDFGIAKAFDVGAHATTTPLGTPVYMSPEQLNGELSSPASDIHALGVILYEALTGIPPFAPTLSVARLIHAICFEIPPAVSAAPGLGPMIAPELDALVAECLAKSPDQRPRAAAVAARLHAIENALLGGARPASPSPSPDPAPPSTVGGMHVGPPPLDTIALVQRFEQRSSRAPVVAAVTFVAVAGLGTGGWWLQNRQRADDAAINPTSPSSPPSSSAPSSLAAAPPTETPAASAECVTQTVLVDAAPLQMLCVRSGAFTMGSATDDPHHEQDETPRHPALVAAFLISATEVTQAQWTAVMGETAFDCKVGCGADLPAQSITWTNAIEFTNRLSVREGLTPCYAAADPQAALVPGCNGYRLPTETEWEFATRAGTTTRFHFGDDDSIVNEYARYGDITGGKTHAVGTKQPNAWGLFDVHGNVWEWVSDWYGPYDTAKTGQDFAGPVSGDFRVIRGFSFKTKSGGPRSAVRGRLKPGGWTKSIGLRVARSPRGRPFEYVAAADPPEATAVASDCQTRAAAWKGKWEIHTIATTGRWLGARAQYDVEFEPNGCGIFGKGTRTQGGEVTWTFTGVAASLPNGDARFSYEPDTPGGSGTWLLRHDGTGTFTSSAGDGSGTLTIDRPNEGL